MNAETRRANATGSDKLWATTNTIVPNVAKTSAWLGIAPHTLPDLRAVRRTDTLPRLTDSRPAHPRRCKCGKGAPSSNAGLQFLDETTGRWCRKRQTREIYE